MLFATCFFDILRAPARCEVIRFPSVHVGVAAFSSVQKDEYERERLRRKWAGRCRPRRRSRSLCIEGQCTTAHIDVRADV